MLQLHVRLIRFAVVLVAGLATLDGAVAQRHGPLRTCEDLKRHGLGAGCDAAPPQSSAKQGRYLCYWRQPRGANGTCSVASFARMAGPCTCRIGGGKVQVGRVGMSTR